MPTEIDQFPVQIGQFSPVVSQYNVNILSINNVQHKSAIDVLSTLNVFSSLFCIVILVIFIFILSNKLLRSFCRYSNSVSNPLWFVLSSLLQGHSNNRKISHFALNAIIILFVFRQLFVNSMSTNLVVKDEKFRLDSLSDFLNFKALQIQPYIISVGILEDWIQYSPEPIAKKIKNHFEKFENVYISDLKILHENIMKNFANLKNQQFALISRSGALDFFISVICSMNFYKSMSDLAGVKFYPYISKNSYFPACHAYLHNISSLENKLRFIDL